ncbi:MAG: MarR family transcriptional regulator [Novosphingobium sp.]|jgi:hypothetical protein|uniref:MarR family transcriptional regulator n=1 Tax=Novosphingobium sp. TaxID=1874826 RepID=UPI0030181706
MGQAARQFDYGTADARAPRVVEMRGRVQDRGTSALAVSIFADRSYLRAEMEEDAAAAGLRIAQTSDLANLLADEPGPAGHDYVLGDLVLVDCPVIDGAELAALARLDLRAAKIGAQLVVSTSIGSLDDVFGCLDQSEAQILVTPSRADRVIALGRTLARAGNRVRELSEEDRLALLRLTEQVGQIAQKLEALSSTSGGAAAQASAFRFDGPDEDGRLDEGTDRLVRTARPPLPDPRLVRKIIRQRQLRARFFEGDLFADPAWDMTSKISGKSIYFKAAA